MHNRCVQLQQFSFSNLSFDLMKFKGYHLGYLFLGVQTFTTNICCLFCFTSSLNIQNTSEEKYIKLPLPPSTLLRLFLPCSDSNGPIVSILNSVSPAFSSLQWSCLNRLFAILWTADHRLQSLQENRIRGNIQKWTFKHGLDSIMPDQPRLRQARCCHVVIFMNVL